MSHRWRSTAHDSEKCCVPSGSAPQKLPTCAGESATHSLCQCMQHQHAVAWRTVYKVLASGLLAIRMDTHLPTHLPARSTTLPPTRLSVKVLVCLISYWDSGNRPHVALIRVAAVQK